MIHVRQMGPALAIRSARSARAGAMDATPHGLRFVSKTDKRTTVYAIDSTLDRLRLAAELLVHSRAIDLGPAVLKALALIERRIEAIESDNKPEFDVIRTWMKVKGLKLWDLLWRPLESIESMTEEERESVLETIEEDRARDMSNGEVPEY